MFIIVEWYTGEGAYRERHEAPIHGFVSDEKNRPSAVIMKRNHLTTVPLSELRVVRAVSMGEI
jgi:hypothetical protein